jgi:hypothetical protein
VIHHTSVRSSDTKVYLNTFLTQRQPLRGVVLRGVVTSFLAEKTLLFRSQLPPNLSRFSEKWHISMCVSRL